MEKFWSAFFYLLNQLLFAAGYIYGAFSFMGWLITLLMPIPAGPLICVFVVLLFIISIFAYFVTTVDFIKQIVE